mmetsp:Transcript_160867/g.296267  ORF Transcript_160867/g.296267 Transcript_160867/m.296267 type:complete len:306 (+) Transcript_160867:59-976(+)
MTETPIPAHKKPRHGSPEKEAMISSWTSGAVRLLQKDMNATMSVIADLSKRVAELESNQNEQPYLELPQFQPAVQYLTMDRLDAVLVEKFGNLNLASIDFAELQKQSSFCRDGLKYFDEKLQSMCKELEEIAFSSARICSLEKHIEELESAAHRQTAASLQNNDSDASSSFCNLETFWYESAQFNGCEEFLCMPWLMEASDEDVQTVDHARGVLSRYTIVRPYSIELSDIDAAEDQSDRVRLVNDVRRALDRGRCSVAVAVACKYKMKEVEYFSQMPDAMLLHEAIETLNSLHHDFYEEFGIPFT